MTRRQSGAQLSVPVGESDHVLGPAGASVTLVEYGDYECPSCGEAYPVVKEVIRALGAKLRFAFRTFPLSTVHPHAELAAEAAEAAGAQGKFWEMHDILFENQEALDYEYLIQYANAIGLEEPQFISELSGRDYAARVRESL
jgi:protein-disulfide isomerase